jgi:hypothetical protein
MDKGSQLRCELLCKILLTVSDLPIWLPNKTRGKKGERRKW